MFLHAFSTNPNAEPTFSRAVYMFLHAVHMNLHATMQKLR